MTKSSGGFKRIKACAERNPTGKAYACHLSLTRKVKNIPFLKKRDRGISMLQRQEKYQNKR
ncbi:MAG: hypothetical protein ACI4I4_07175 [Acutalibacteraceae bacterium]